MPVEITRRATAAMLLAGMATPALAQPRVSASSKRDADRRAILAMAGDYRVRFDFRETVPFVDDYKPIAPHVTGGTEIVRAIEDADEVIRLQHILVMDDTSGPIIIKHWRQDWTYEPRSVLQYQGPSTWTVMNLDARVRQGAWSQTVWQTDDSPRYGGVGVWEHTNGVSSWTSAPTLRPLARRDAARKPPYDRYRGINRHALTPTGWVHEQDNAKIGLRNGVPTTFVHETVINTYTRNTAFPIPAGDAYWSKTQDYWRAVRAEWGRVIGAERGIRVTEEAENGATTGPALMDLADQVAEGTLTNTAAIDQAKQVIRDKR